jgi:hypothetical protein
VLNRTLSCKFEKWCKFSSHTKAQSRKKKSCKERPACTYYRLISAGAESGLLMDIMPNLRTTDPEPSNLQAEAFTTGIKIESGYFFTFNS